MCSKIYDPLLAIKLFLNLRTMQSLTYEYPVAQDVDFDVAQDVDFDVAQDVNFDVAQDVAQDVDFDLAPVTA